MSAHLTKVPNERLLYINAKGMYYLRKRNENEDTDICLKTTKLRVAIKLRDTYSVDRLESQLGGKKAPKAKRYQICSALDLYHADEHPTIRRNIQKHPGERHMRCEVDAIPMLKKFFKKRFVDELTQDLLDEYCKWRPTQSLRDDDCLRTVDLELNTLSNALHWAQRKKKITVNPIASHTRYYDPSKARKTKHVAPKTTAEAHGAGAHLFADRRSESVSWQWMFEWMSGGRTEESLKLLFQPELNDALGHVDGDHMWVRPSDKNDQGQPYLFLHDGLKALLKAHAIWHEARYPENPYMFPGRDKESGEPLSQWSLTSALDRLFEDGLIPRKLTSHGAHGGYVVVRRSHGISDSQIATEINQIGGLETLRDSYGVCPQSWLDGKGPKLPWIPESGPCWAKLMLTLGKQQLKIEDKTASNSHFS